MATKKRTTSNPESARTTERVVLRCPPDLAERIRTRAHERGTTMARLFADALDALDGKKVRR